MAKSKFKKPKKTGVLEIDDKYLEFAEANEPLHPRKSYGKIGGFLPVASPLFFAALVKALPSLRRIVAGRPECWPKPPQETITVSKADLIEWRNDWLQAYAKGDGTDEVTPFDQYLYGRKP